MVIDAKWGEDTTAVADREPAELSETLLSLAPAAGEEAVLSLLAVRDEHGAWVALSGSLLAIPEEAAHMSWPAWERDQPRTRGPSQLPSDLDLGPWLDEEPFSGIRMLRIPLGRSEWARAAQMLNDGEIETGSEPIRFRRGDWSAPGLYAQDGQTDAHRVLRAAKRPVRGIAASLEAPALPFSDSLWSRGGPAKPVMEQTRDELAGRPTFANWPISLLGVGWIGGDDYEPPPCFVIGRATRDAWITDAILDHRNDLINIPLGWEEGRIDPLSCSVAFRCARDGPVLLSSQWKVSDLPGKLTIDEQGREARQLPWNQRTISVVVPRGPRNTEWGVSLLGPDGALLDELDVARRVESIEMAVGVAGAELPPMRSVAGDPRPRPSEDEVHRAVLEARELEQETRRHAAERRLCTAGELSDYLRWRFSAREGELLVIDRYLLDGKSDVVVEAVVEFLAAFNRPIRALVSKSRPVATELLARNPGIIARKVSKDHSHDRIWIVGETAVAVGTSPNQFLGEDGSAATTAVDLPFADGVNWAATRFAEQWDAATPLS